MSTGDPSRKRNLTEKGQSLYESTMNKHIIAVCKAWEPLENIFTEFSELPKDLKSLRNIEKTILSYQNTYSIKAKDYADFLARTSTEQSAQTLQEFEAELQQCGGIIDNFLKQLKQLKLDIAETLSKTSTSTTNTNTTKSSVSTTSSSKLAKKRLNAEVMRTKLQYMEQQANLLEQKAKIEAELSLIHQKSETAVAEVKLQAVEQEERQSRLNKPVFSVPDIGREPPQSVKETFVKQYVVDQQKIKSEQEVVQHYVKQEDNYSMVTPDPRPPISVYPTPVYQSKPHYNAQPLNPHASNFQPRLTSSAIPGNQNQSVVFDVTKFLLKKDLLLSRFQQFDDRPESYASWKISFSSITAELDVTAFEEMDLLIKWLGPESSKFANTIRASNVTNPERGLERIWSRLEDRFGKPEMVESAIKAKLQKFPKLTNKDTTKYFDLLDILTQIESSKENMNYSTLLSYYDSSSGVLPIIEKLPFNIQEKWTNHASRYKVTNNVPFPPFSVFVDFIRDICRVKNDPAFMYQNSESTNARKPDAKRNQTSNTVFNRKTDVSEAKSTTPKHTNSNFCPIHKANHSLSSCRVFCAMKVFDRKKLLKENELCFKCFSSNHIANDCKKEVECKICGKNNHNTLMHSVPKSANGGENNIQHVKNQQDDINVTVKRTSLPQFSGRSCGKVVKVRVFPKGFPEKATQVYAILDDQSNKTLANSKLFDDFSINSDIIKYTMSSCSGSTRMHGRYIDTLVVESLCSDDSVEIKSVIECSALPEDRSEIPTPDIAKMYEHLNSIAKEIPEIDSRVKVQLLIGRDMPEVHHVLQQIVGPKELPFAQKLTFGWVIIGEVCLGKLHRPLSVVANKTTVMNNGRGTIFEPCLNTLYVKQCDTGEEVHDTVTYDSVFQVTKNDDKISLSMEDKKFLDLMNSEFKKDENGHWTAPLPFRSDQRNMPNNRSQAWRRAQILDSSLRKNPVKRKHFVEFMQKVLASGAAEVAPQIPSDKERWYLPLFGVYHPHKPDRIRGVFDSSAKYEGISLNQMLMTGPDLTNNLVGILLRFRNDKVAAIGDIEQMFYQFYVDIKDRDYLRFFWYENNDPDNPLIEFRMRVHVFGNSPSPAIATFGLRKTVEKCDDDVRKFVGENFYVDDGLISLPDSNQVVDILKRTQEALKVNGQIRLHKIASNCADVLTAFPKTDISSDLHVSTLDIAESYFPPHASLGLSWNLNNDTFVFHPLTKEKPCTRRGILSSLNSVRSDWFLVSHNNQWKNLTS